ncbi:MAG: NAD(P)-dependent oxidoreductase, partial [Pseudomonadota bacterium]
MAKTDMLTFVDRKQATPPKRDAELRQEDFEEIYVRFAPQDAADQASRCSQCGVPYCQIHCPLQNNIPDWLKLTAEGRIEEAYELSSETSTMPEICGRICPQDRLCEGNCVIEADFNSVTIGAVEKYLTDTAWEKGWVAPIAVGRSTGQSVGIIGAGPAGLAAAERLRIAGHAVTIYDRYDRAGGLLTYGIPGFKLEKEVVMRRVERLTSAGVEFTLNVDIGRDLTFQELQRRHEAIFIATGVYKARALDVPGIDLRGVHPAMDFLTASNRKGFGDVVAEFDNGALNAENRDVVVIGGGDTAMDCVRTAVRQGAKSVSCLYRRNRENMPGSLREVANAEEEGVTFLWQSAPEALLGDDAVRAIRAYKMSLGPVDATGRQSPVPIPGSGFELAADLVIEALGFDPEDQPKAFDMPDLGVTRWGTLLTDQNSM